MIYCEHGRVYYQYALTLAAIAVVGALVQLGLERLGEVPAAHLLVHDAVIQETRLNHTPPEPAPSAPSAVIFAADGRVLVFDAQAVEANEAGHPAPAPPVGSPAALPSVSSGAAAGESATGNEL